jgi:hypothetical protein
MSEPLVTYLGDHLGGAQVAIQLLEAMRDQQEGDRFREFATLLLPEIEADHRTLHSIAESVDASPSITKQVGGWLLEKASRLKLGHTSSTDFEMFEALELLALGVQGKLSLWKALQTGSRLDSRLREYNFEELIGRAQYQHDKVESLRLDLARTVFSTINEKG